ncbi:YveK family protein [Geodermatophilus sp. SYSU D00691]
MELRDYLAAVRRHWVLWIAATVVGALVALLVVAQTPKTYEATSTVFASVSPSIPNNSSFVQSRVKSYPELVDSAAVLTPVLDDLDLDESLADLRSRVSATNPADTTQLLVTVSGPDPDEAAAVANAVADQFADVVETLETPSSGDEPIHLTLADPAVAPTSPSSPVTLYVVALGVLVGLFLGLAAAVVRSRLDPTVHDEDDLRRALDDDAPELLVQPIGRGRRSALTGHPAVTLARRLELRAEERPIRVVLASPSPAETRATRAFADQVAEVLRGRGLTTAVTGPDDAAGDEEARVRLEIVDPLVPQRVWQQVARRSDVVLVVARGRVQGREVQEMRSILRAVGIVPLAVALVPRRLRRLPKAAGRPRIDPPAVPGAGRGPADAPAPVAGRPAEEEHAGAEPAAASSGGEHSQRW